MRPLDSIYIDVKLDVDRTVIFVALHLRFRWVFNNKCYNCDGIWPCFHICISLGTICRYQLYLFKCITIHYVSSDIETEVAGIF